MKTRPICFDISGIPPEYNIEDEKKFDKVKVVREGMKPDGNFEYLGP